MSSVIAAPELMAETATDLATIGSTLSAARMAAATPTVAVMSAAADEVSASIAHLFFPARPGLSGAGLWASGGNTPRFHSLFGRARQRSDGNRRSRLSGNPRIQPTNSAGGPNFEDLMLVSFAPILRVL
jgi:PE family protein